MPIVASRSRLVKSGIVRSARVGVLVVSGSGRSGRRSVNVPIGRAVVVSVRGRGGGNDRERQRKEKGRWVLSRDLNILFCEVSGAAI